MSISKVPNELMEEGKYNEALELLHSKRDTAVMATGPNGYFSLISETKIAEVICKQGRYSEALKMFKDIEKKFSAFSKLYESDVLTVKENIANVFSHLGNYGEARKIYEEIYTCRLQSLGPNEPLTVKAKRNMAVTHSKSGNYDEALSILEEVYRNRASYNGFKDSDILLVCSDIAEVFLEQSKYDVAMNIFEEIYEILQQKKPNDWSTLIARCNIANVYKRQQKYSEAMEIYGEVYLIQNKSKPKHPVTLNTLQSMAEILKEQGEYNSALLFLRKLFDIRNVECPLHPDTLKIERYITTILLKLEMFVEAMDSYEVLLGKVCKIFGDQGELALEIQQDVALNLFEKEKYDEALAIFTKVHGIQSTMTDFGPNHPDTLMTKINIGGAYLDLSRYDEALKIFKEVLEKITETLGPNNSSCVTVRNNIAAIYAHQKKYNEAFQIYYEIYEMQAKTLGLEHPDTLKAERNIDLLSDEAPRSKLFRTVIAGDLDLLKFRMLIEDVDVNEIDINGSSPLHVASEKGYFPIVKFLLAKGAYYNIKNRKNKTPSDLAANDEIKNSFCSIESLFEVVKEGNYERISDVLKEDTAFITNARDETGNTCLHWACSKGLENIVKLLLNMGADPLLENKEGHTPLHMANKYEEIEQVLQKHIKKPDPYDFLNISVATEEVTSINTAASESSLSITHLIKSETNPAADIEQRCMETE